VRLILMVETCSRKLQAGCRIESVGIRGENGKQKTMARDFDDEWLQESSDGCGAVYFAVLCEFFASSAVKPSAETAKFAKEDAKLRKGMAVPI
jgi:hypothetical protein